MVAPRTCTRHVALGDGGDLMTELLGGLLAVGISLLLVSVAYRVRDEIAAWRSLVEDRSEGEE